MNLFDKIFQTELSKELLFQEIIGEQEKGLQNMLVQQCSSLRTDGRVIMFSNCMNCEFEVRKKPEAGVFYVSVLAKMVVYSKYHTLHITMS